jgi:hypothetical protein
MDRGESRLAVADSIAEAVFVVSLDTVLDRALHGGSIRRAGKHQAAVPAR